MGEQRQARVGRQETTGGCGTTDSERMCSTAPSHTTCRDATPFRMQSQTSLRRLSPHTLDPGQCIGEGEGGGSHVSLQCSCNVDSLRSRRVVRPPFAPQPHDTRYDTAPSQGPYATVTKLAVSRDDSPPPRPKSARGLIYLLVA